MNNTTERLRPKSFSGIIGAANQPTIKRYQSMLSKDCLSNITCIEAPIGAAKTTLARIIARAYLCKNRSTGISEPCGNCNSCTAVLDERGLFSNYSESNCSELREADIFGLLQFGNRPGVVTVLDEFQDLPMGAQLALRKPMERVVGKFIFLLSDRSTIDDAVLNRLKPYTYRLYRPSVDEAAGYLERRFSNDELKFESRAQLIRVAEAYHCNMRYCVEFPDKVRNEFDGELSNDVLDELFGIEESDEPSLPII